MAYPEESGHFILDTDACDYGIGAVLSQVQNGTERVIAYGSRTLSKSERNYCVTDKELLAVHYFIEYFRHYLLGQEFMVRSDHQALKWLFTLKEPKGRIARWIETLSAYNFKIEYRPGKRHSNADSLSGLCNPHQCTCPTDELVTLKCGPCKKCIKKQIDMHSTCQQCNKANRLTLNMESRIPREENYPKQGMSRKFCILLQVFLGIIGCIMETLISFTQTKLNLLTAFITVRSKSMENPSDGRHPHIQEWIGSILSWMVHWKHHSVMVPLLRKIQAKNKELNKSWIQKYTKEELRTLQMNDPAIGKVLQWKEAGFRPFGAEVCASSPEVRHYWQYWDSL